MPSGHFQSFPVAAITVDRGNRQRKDLGDLGPLASSLARVGLINPVVIRRDDSVLVAGERRLASAQSLGWTHINVQFAEDLDAAELQLIELEENVKRLDLDWKDRVAATKRYHELCVARDPSWTADNTAEALNVTNKMVWQHVAVADELTKGNTKVAAADSLAVAKGIIARDNERRKTSALASIGKVAGVEPNETPLLLADFNTWAPSYTGPRFNFIHCDFPYGINADNQQLGNNVAAFGGYSDTPEVYYKLLRTLAHAMDNVVAESAHLMFWFSMRHYHETFTALTTAGWRVDPFPLIWHKSDNVGLLPDPKRGGRRVYETAFQASRGDRFIASPVANAVSLPTTAEVHMSEKPIPVLTHFFRMFVDEHTAILDPTCGSGTAIRAAANASVRLGLEINQESYNKAKEKF